MQPRTTAVILAAGHSSRMGRFKPLLSMNGQTVIERVVSTFRSGGAADILVVIGNRAGEMTAALAPLGVQTALNRDYDAGMFSSVMTGVRQVDRSSSGFFVHPADIPLVRPATIAALTGQFTKTPDALCYPYFMGRRGHPPLIPAGMADAILAWPGRGGLRGFLETREDAAVNVPVPDEGVLIDMDGPEDYAAALARLAHADIPAAPERQMMTAIRNLPENIIRHCRAVASVARALADAASAAGAQIDARLACAAATVHDIARAEPSHAAAGADVLRRWGFPRVADIVRVHMDIAPDDGGPLTEAEIVYLADKCIAGDALADLEERFSRKRAKYGKYPEAVAAIQRRRDAALRIKTKIEKLTGRSVMDILKDIPPPENNVF